MKATKIEFLKGLGPFRVEGKFSLKRDLRVCLVYVVWDKNYYLNMLHRSLYSQLKYTDISNFCIKVFVDYNLLSKAKQLLTPLCEGIEIIPMVISKESGDRDEFLSNTLLGIHDYIFISNCDQVVYSTGRKDFYTYFAESPSVVVTPSFQESSQCCNTDFIGIPMNFLRACKGYSRYLFKPHALYYLQIRLQKAQQNMMPVQEFIPHVEISPMSEQFNLDALIKDKVHILEVSETCETFKRFLKHSL